MAELATVARPYAEALFRVAQTGDMNAYSAIASELGQIGASADVQTFASNPIVTHAQLADTIASLVKSPLNAEAKNFIAMLAENGRINLLPEISTQFAILKNANEGAADATIFSAFEISADQLSPSSLTAWRQSPSQSLLNRFSLVMVSSPILPASDSETL